MSSTYHPICLSHDPAIILGAEFTHEEAEALSDRDRLRDHETCDIVIGRFSYPLVEVACLGRRFPGPSGCNSYHGGPEWVRAEWLRILAAATPDADPQILAPLTERGCWPLERLNRLRIDLDLPKPTPASLTRKALREVLSSFAVATSAGQLHGYAGPAAVAPEDFERWHAALGDAHAPWPNVREAP